VIGTAIGGASLVFATGGAALLLGGLAVGAGLSGSINVI
jgi:hypothetical protein